MRIFDTHAHYDSGAFNSDRYELLADLPNQDVELILNPGCDLESSRTAVALADLLRGKTEATQKVSIAYTTYAG